MKMVAVGAFGKPYPLLMSNGSFHLGQGTYREHGARSSHLGPSQVETSGLERVKPLWVYAPEQGTRWPLSSIVLW